MRSLKLLNLLASFVLLACATAAAAEQPAPITLDLSKEERAALTPVRNAVEAKNWEAARAALPAAAAVAHTPSALFALGRFRLEIGLGINDVLMQAEGIDALIASGKTPAADLPILYRNRAVLANNAGNKEKAEAAFAKVAELTPNHPEALVSLAQVKVDLRKTQEAVQLLLRAIDIKRKAGQAVDESWFKYALKVAYDGRQNPALRAAVTRLSGDLVAAYPTEVNWRDALLIHLDTGGLDAAGQLDLLRLMRATGALAGERDWFDLADGLYRAGNHGEAKAVLDDAVAKRLVDPAKPAFAELIRLNDTRVQGDRAALAAEQARAMAAPDGKLALKIGDAFHGYGEHAKAIALHRAALAKGGVERDLVNTRLAIALLTAGDRTGAEAAFKSVGGTRKQLAALWLAWMARAPR